MPASYSMTWEPKPRRWRIMHKGKLYTVSCRKLGVCLSIAFWKRDSNNPVVQGSRAPDVARFCDE
jgi:hypothetical protein